MARDKTLVRTRDDQEEFSEEEEEYEIHGSRASSGGRGGGKSRGGSSRKRRRSIFVDDVAEEADDDEEDEEYDDEEEDNRKGRKKMRKNSFIDDEAIVASSDEDVSTDGEGEDGGEPFIVSNDEILQDDDDVTKMGRHGHQQPWLSDDEEDIEEIERRVQQRYQSYDEEFDEADINDVEQQSRLPSVKDSKLWTVKCAIGREREAAICLMQKCYDLPAGMHIRSAIALDYLQNYIYVEADKEAHVREACKGLKMLDTRKIVLVPIKEMTDVVSAKSKAIDILKDMWVRMKIGVYKGDIAKVVSVPDMRQRVMVKLIPRVDLQAVADKVQGRKVLKKAIVLPPRLVNSDEARNLSIPVDFRRERSTGISFDLIDGKTFKDGFLYKIVSKKSIEYQNIQPSFNELEIFCESGHGVGGSMSTSRGNRRKCNYMKGDAVMVVKGDLINLMGWVQKVEDDNLHIKPNRKDLHTTVVVNAKYVCKYFKAGDHVKVVSGAHAGVTGTVIKVNSNVLIIVSDATREDITVFADNVVNSSEVTSGATTRIGDYELHDVVMLGDMSVGVIIRLEGESLQVLKGDPDRPVVAVVKLREIKYKIEKRSTAQDCSNNTVSVKDVVKILNGPCQGKQGLVKHIHRGILFINDRHHMEHSGFICVKGGSCIVMGGSGSPSSRCVTSTQAAYIPPSSRRYSTGPPLDSGGRHGGFGLRGIDSFVGSMVKIRVGNYKGCSGRVVSRIGQLVRVELESQMKTVTLKREEISVDAGVFTSFRETPQHGIGGETPMHRAQTPLHPYMTPMRDQGGETPVHTGMRTPLRHQAWNPYAISSPARGTSPQCQRGSPLPRTNNAPALTTVSGWD
ncbi:hypothetical protein MKX01_011429 [Papaver californicum]|nr:hypothetical protein MKX01_011429 [Papaver californicum]